MMILSPSRVDSHPDFRFRFVGNLFFFLPSVRLLFYRGAYHDCLGKFHNENSIRGS